MSLVVMRVKKRKAQTAMTMYEAMRLAESKGYRVSLQANGEWFLIRISDRQIANTGYTLLDAVSILVDTPQTNTTEAEAAFDFEERIEDLADSMGAIWQYDGTAIVFSRNNWQLSHAGERQTLPIYSAPLMLGNSAVCGQGWLEVEVRQFAALVGATIIFERYIDRRYR